VLSEVEFQTGEFSREYLPFSASGKSNLPADMFEKGLLGRSAAIKPGEKTLRWVHWGRDLSRRFGELRPGFPKGLGLNYLFVKDRKRPGDSLVGRAESDSHRVVIGPGV
jgi:hypothetical protein